MKTYNVKVKYFDQPDQIVVNVKAKSKTAAALQVAARLGNGYNNMEKGTGWASCEAFEVLGKTGQLFS